MVGQEDGVMYAALAAYTRVRAGRRRKEDGWHASIRLSFRAETSSSVVRGVEYRGRVTGFDGVTGLGLRLSTLRV